MAEQTSANVSDLVFLIETVITQKHNPRKCQSVWHKINNFLAKRKWFQVFEDAICYYYHVLYIRNIKYTIDLMADSVVCYVPI